MANRFFTVLIVPEKAAQVRRIVVPAWLFRTSLIGVFFVAVLATIMLIDYWYVAGRISENQDLKVENRRLRQQVQIFKNRMVTVEDTLDRIESFTTRLKNVTGIETQDTLVRKLQKARDSREASRRSNRLKKKALRIPILEPQQSAKSKNSTDETLSDKSSSTNT